MNQQVEIMYLVVRRNDLSIDSEHLGFISKTDAYEYALECAHQEPTNSNFEWKVVQVLVHTNKAIK